MGTKRVGKIVGSVLETASIGDSRHWGVETYCELDPLAIIAPSLVESLGSLDFFSSLAYVDARYVTGEFAGNRVEQAPRIVDRTGVTYSRGPVSMTLQYSYTSRSFGDAYNSMLPSRDNMSAGLVPASTTIDWCSRLGVSAQSTV